MSATIENPEATGPAVGASTHREPPGSCQLASAPGTKSAAVEYTGVL